VSIAYRNALAGDSAGTSSLTQTVTLPTGWAGGDFCLIGAEQGDVTTPTFTTPSGWTLLDDGENSAAYSYCFYYRVLQAGDSNPTLTSSVSAPWDWNSIGVYSTVGGTLSLDAHATLATTTSLGNTITPNAATASQAGDASLIMLSGRAGSTAVDITSYTNSPPTGWTNGSSDVYQQNTSTTTQRMTASMYQLGLSAGTVTPGSDSFTTSASQTFRFAAEHVLVLETVGTLVPPLISQYSGFF